MGKNILIGLATEKILKNKKHPERIQPYKLREARLRSCLEKELGIPRGYYEITPLNDPLGPVITDAKIEAQICSTETQRGCFNINKIRIANGIQPTAIIMIPLILNSSGNKLSSTDIRAELQEMEVKENNEMLLLKS